MTRTATTTARAEPRAPASEPLSVLHPPPPAPDADAIARALEAFAGRRVAVALSGGVDSAVAAHRLVRAGAHVVGLALRLHDPEPHNPLAPRACCAPDDLQDARRVAEHLDVPFYVVDAREAFERGVVKPFVDAYLAGTTPSPCVGCNAFVKLDVLHARARALGAAALATGHYARVLREGPWLYRGVDAKKDQSYFLFGTRRAILADLVFPLGASTKAQVRDEALAAGLPVAHKLDSQEVCFVGGGGAGRYVMQRPEAEALRGGTIVDDAGQVLGEHAGVAHFTVGQRRNLGLGTHRRLFVLSIDAAERRVVVGDEDALLRDRLRASRAAWPSGVPPVGARVDAKIRSRDAGTPATVVAADAHTLELRFDAPVRAITPGQAVVLYVGEAVIGGAWIEGAA